MLPGGAMGAQWLLVGSLTDDVQWGQIAMGAAVALAGLAIGVSAGPAMDAATLADDEASSVGVRIGRLRAVLFVAAGAMTAAAVAIAGPIGFVGLICPHVVRLMAGGSAAVAHRWLVIGSALAGAALIVGADAAVKMVYLDTGRMPLGVITTVVGGVVFLGLLRREGRAMGV
jgi:iron complex transport system permease protein